MSSKQGRLDEASSFWLKTLDLEGFGRARRQLGKWVRRTPLWRWDSTLLAARLPGSEVWLKLELLQVTGTFKARGALLNLLAAEDLSRGVTAVSAGNHAIAVSWAARTLGATAKVVMPENANPIRVQRCRDFGGEVVLAADVHEAFDRVRRIEAEEGRLFVHPFEGRNTLLGTGSLGWEIGDQWGSDREPDAIVVPVGGGGLIGGVAAAIKLRFPNCRVIGVEPRGADTLTRSLAAGRPQSIDRVDTIADSLGAPHAAPLSFALAQRFVDEVVLIDDSDMQRAMKLLFDEAKLAVEPAGAASTAAILGPLRERLAEARVVPLVCGSNIDAESFGAHLDAARRREMEAR